MHHHTFSINEYRSTSVMCVCVCVRAQHSNEHSELTNALLVVINSETTIQQRNRIVSTDHGYYTEALHTIFSSTVGHKTQTQTPNARIRATCVLALGQRNGIFQNILPTINVQLLSTVYECAIRKFHPGQTVHIARTNGEIVLTAVRFLHSFLVHMLLLSQMYIFPFLGFWLFLFARVSACYGQVDMVCNI